VKIAQGSSKVQKTYYPKAGEIEPQWYVLDAEDMNLGRLAARIARLLLGKDKPQYTPGVDTGDFVIVINADKISVTGNRLD
jgi:large subunit ribosomal protein L13